MADLPPANGTTTLDRLAAGGPRLSVGLLTADLGDLRGELGVLESAGAELVHIDVMDGVFCPQLTVGAPFVRAVRTPLLKDVHVMVHEPLSKLDALVEAGADLVTVHLEGEIHPHRVLQVLGAAQNANDPARGLVRGVGVNPGTPLAVLEPLLGDLDLIVILAVDPGFPGQSFLPSTERRLGDCRELIERSGRRILLGVDGGVTFANAERVARLGVDLVVAGSAVFDGHAAAQNARRMLDVMAAARAASAAA